ncbi:MAG TPA: NAD(P)-dependent oxidoreductase [Candidatus Dormibacteraeota bacterium]|nr:NAD(P)-dependent oxidoreductase [Candidatus Dormibacteraeota bacterium]
MTPGRAAGPALVTGGAGFIGGYVTRELVDLGRQVTVLTRGPSSTPGMRYVLKDHAERFATEIGSVEDLPALLATFERVRPATVVHAASNVEVAKLFRDPYPAFQTNVTGTLNVLEAARRTGVQRVVDISSIGVLPAIQYEPIDAAHPIMLAREGPGSGAYGAAKASGELFAFAYQRAYGLDVRIVRPSAVYGFGMQWHSSNYMKEFVEPAVRGEKVRVQSGGRLPRDYTHVQDVASLTVRVVDCDDGADRIFYAATGRPLVTAEQTASLVGERLPGSSVEVADAMTPEDEVEASFRGVISIASAKAQLGWTPRYASLRDGIQQYIDSYRPFLAEGAY